MAKRRPTVPKSAPSTARRAVVDQPAWRRYMPWIGGGLLLAVLLVAGILIANPSSAGAGVPGQRMLIQGQQHIEVGASHPPYNSDPPTSGWHYDTPIRAGFYEEPQADEYVVHNLEHGHVVISYDCSKLTNCEDTKYQLRRLLNAYNGFKVTIVPRTNVDAAIALTAWGWIDKLDSYDEARIRRFIDAWRNRGPEATME